jgi:uncharacterized membrane protein YsdA (DUF1294 family)
MNYGLLLEIILIVVNVIALAAFGLDKFQSKRGGWRVPELRLLLFAFFGPFGALAGMLLFRHKTRKIKFLLVPFLVFLQGFLLLYLFGVGYFSLGNFFL